MSANETSEFLRQIADLKELLTSKDLQCSFLMGEYEQLTHRNSENSVQLQTMMKLLDTMRLEQSTHVEMINLLQDKGVSLSQDHERARSALSMCEERLSHSESQRRRVEAHEKALEEAYARLALESQDLLAYATAADKEITALRKLAIDVTDAGTRVGMKSKRGLDRALRALQEALLEIADVQNSNQEFSLVVGTSESRGDFLHISLPVVTQIPVPVRDVTARLSPQQPKPISSSVPSTAEHSTGFGMGTSVGSDSVSSTRMADVVVASPGADARAALQMLLASGGSLRLVPSTGASQSPIDRMYVKARAPVVEPTVNGRDEERQQWERAMAYNEDVVRQATRSTLAPVPEYELRSPSPKASVAAAGSAPSAYYARVLPGGAGLRKAPNKSKALATGQRIMAGSRHI